MSRQLAADIAAYIASNSLPEGAHLRTSDLAQRFGVSRWPVEQALREMAQAGRVRHEANRGFFVRLDGAATEPAACDPVHDAYLALAIALVEGRIGPLLTEQQIRDSYGLTKRQTSDLMGRLIREGIAEKRAGYGWNINAELTAPDALSHATQMRLVLEPAALRLQNYHLPADEIARLRRVEHELLNGAIDNAAPDALFLRGAQFHEAIMSGAANPFMLQALIRLNRVRRLLTYRAMDDRARYYRQSRQHLRILALIEERNPAGAADEMERHLQQVQASLSKLGLIPSKD